MKRMIIFVVIFIVTLIVIFLYVVSKIAPILTESHIILPKYLPIILQPSNDKNKLIAVYYYVFPDKNTTEITVVFNGESHPNWFIDKIYTFYRLFRYHRVKDMETFYLKTDEQGKPQEIDFFYKETGTYSNKQTYYTPNTKHYTKEILYSEFEFSDNRPHVYVNTWNHLFSEKNNNPELSYITWREYPIAIGTREKAEYDFRFGFKKCLKLISCFKER